jgi:mannose-6-phosphate isomerase-like protein (cupin superfamily)
VTDVVVTAEIVDTSFRDNMRAGETIRNKQTGEALTVLVSEEETAGARQLYQVYIPAKRPSPPSHYHRNFTETFSVLEGKLDIYLGRERRHILLDSQQSVTASIGQVHTFANERDTPALITIETEPAAGVIRAFQLADGIANEGGASPDGLPRNPLVRLVFIKMSEGFLPDIPLFLQKAVYNLAAFIAQFTWMQRTLKKYFSPAP